MTPCAICDLIVAGAVIAVAAVVWLMATTPPPKSMD